MVKPNTFFHIVDNKVPIYQSKVLEGPSSTVIFNFTESFPLVVTYGDGHDPKHCKLSDISILLSKALTYCISLINSVAAL